MTAFTAIDFLKDLTLNNKREWFQANHERFIQAKDDVERLTARLIALISEFDDSVRGIQAKDCIYRIYRDLRFSKDKTPYKEHFGVYISKGGKKGIHAGYYLHIMPFNQSFFCGGTYGLTPAQMKEVKLSILDEMDRFTSIVEGKPFKEAFGELEDMRLSRLPAYIPKDTPDSAYFLYKDYLASLPLKDDFFSLEDCAEQLAMKARALKPFLDFLNYTIDDL